MNVNSTIKLWRVAGYSRLSKEDGDREESNSISNQKELIYNYINSHPEFQLIDQYSDDGYTGINFERPSFQEMLNSIRHGKINCIIVKDLSRFGRNYIECGRFIERVFPYLGIRFIAINDNYDSQYNNLNSDLLLLPFKNLINDIYSRDISIKVRTSLKVKWGHGDFVSAIVPYGYKRAENNKNQLIIDNPAANIVKLIFAKKMDGFSNERIASYLNEIKVPSPLMYKQENGINAKTSFQIQSKTSWYRTTIKRILENEVYTGTLIQGKWFRPNYKIRKAVAKPHENWIRTVNTHEAIISKETFSFVQSISSENTRLLANCETLYLFSGIVHCGSCNQLCTRKRITNNKNGGYTYYGCYLPSHKARCKGYAINESHLERIIVSILKQYIYNFTDLQKIMITLKNLPSEPSSIKVLLAEYKKRESTLHKYKGFIISLYKDYHEGLLDKSEYLELKTEYEQQVKELSILLNSLNLQLLTCFSSENTPVNNFQEYLKNLKLSRKMLVSIIKKIYIYPKNRISIIFRFQDEFNNLPLLFTRRE